MGIFDTVMAVAQRHSEMNAEQHSGLVQSATEMFGNQSGISGLLSNAHSQGLGGIVSSWIGNGPNQSIAPQQVQGLVGPDRIEQIATRVGIPSIIASAALAHILPIVVDKMTPGGRVSRAA